MAFKSYREILGRREDFLIKYRYLTPIEGGRKNLPFQHIRNDFWYEHPNNDPNNVFMIYPEFLNEKGSIIEDGEVLREGIAKMWIIMPEMFEYHKARMKVGQRGFFHEGFKRTGECEIVKIVGLHDL